MRAAILRQSRTHRKSRILFYFCDSDRASGQSDGWNVSHGVSVIQITQTVAKNRLKRQRKQLAIGMQQNFDGREKSRRKPFATRQSVCDSIYG